MWFLRTSRWRWYTRTRTSLLSISPRGWWYTQHRDTRTVRWVNALLYHCGESLSGINGELRPGIVHRIDRDTSGLIIAAKNDTAHVRLAEQLQDHTLARTYRCIVVGGLREDSGTVDAPIGGAPTDRKKMAVVSGGRRAVTHWTALERFPGATYVECRLETGRTHQIRVHMAYIGHPILGDTVYGSKKAVPGLQGQCLHAVVCGSSTPAPGRWWRFPARCRRSLSGS